MLNHSYIEQLKRVMQQALPWMIIYVNLENQWCNWALWQSSINFFHIKTFVHTEQLSEASNHQKSSKGLNLNIKIGIQILSNALNISKNPASASLVGHSHNLKKHHGL